MAKKRKGKKHTSLHFNQVHHPDGFAHPTHGAQNKEHGMPEGLSAAGGYDGADEYEGSHLGENEECEHE